MRGPRRDVRAPFEGRRVLLGVTGGIAAYKSITLARDLTLAGAEVDVVLSGAALEFVRPLSFEALTGRPAYSELYTPGDPLLHIRLARESHLILIAPATANFIARTAAGMADDLLCAVLLATTAPVLLCPAMNDQMFLHPQTQRNLSHLAELGYGIAGPAEGPLAWGEGSGRGRMLEPEEILDHAGQALTEENPLRGTHILISAGPTREPIDPVRFIGNRSSGRMGFALAADAWRRGAEVTLVAGPSSLPTPTGVRRVEIETAEEMLRAIEAHLPGADVLIMAAAVADFRPSAPAEQKIKKGEHGLELLRLEPTADVLRSTIAQRRPGALIVGFALETQSPLEHGREKLASKQLDLLVINDATEPGAGFEVATNRVTLLDREGTELEVPLQSKEGVAREILDHVARLRSSKP